MSRTQARPLPQTGGRYTRDPKTGELTNALTGAPAGETVNADPQASSAANTPAGAVETPEAAPPRKTLRSRKAD